MERFAFKIDKTLRANLYKICRLCGMDNPEKVNILDDENSVCNPDDGEPELWEKVQACVGFTVSKDDKMPQTMCSLCVDKINDFYEFREMCFATNIQTRKLLGLKEEMKPSPSVISVHQGLDVKYPLPSIVTKAKRKRKADDMFAKEAIKTYFEEIKTEKPATLMLGTPSRKKTKSSNAPVASTALIVNTANSGFLMQNKSKPLTTLQRRAIEQMEKIRPKPEIKDEFLDMATISSRDPHSSLLHTKFSGKFKQFCNICDLRFLTKPQLDRHLSSTHVPNIPRYVCTACNETIKKNREIKNHQLWHKLSKTPFVCSLCGEKLLNTYAYTRHLREHATNISTPLMVLDRECPQCHDTFATNYLYNIHPCSLQTKKCAGCNRVLKNECEYLRHAPTCPNMFLNYSKHISVASIVEESAIRIKNENDVEAAAAAEALALNAGTSLDLTRLSAPFLMQSNQCVLIPGHQMAAVGENAQITPTTSSTKLAKKKGGVSLKDFKRVDELLKSTMDTLVSIKHEPEVHVDSCERMSGASGAEDEDVGNDSPLPTDDFHDDSNDDGVYDVSMLASVTIKQELIEESENMNENVPDVDISNIKQEPGDSSKIPVLKLKITKEHGKLNSSLVQEEDVLRGDKKKKKKKRKDSDKDKEKPSDEHQEVLRQSAFLVPEPGIIRIKQERLDDGYPGSPLMSTTPHRDNNDSQMHSTSAFVTSTIAQPQPALSFHISAVSSGVDFNHENRSEPNLEPEDNDNADVQHDIKPCRETLDRLLQITHVSCGVEMSRDDDNAPKSTKRSTTTTTPHQPDESPTPLKIKRVDSETVRSTSGVACNLSLGTVATSLPQIVAVSGGKDVADKFGAVETEDSAGFIKKERLDADYGDVLPEEANEENNMAGYRENRLSNMQQQQQQQHHHHLNQFPTCNSPASEAIENSHSTVANTGNEARNNEKLSEEQAYIANIDFNNIIIKEEKEIEVSEVELNDPAPRLPNGYRARKKPQHKNLSRADEVPMDAEAEDEECEEEEGGEEDDEYREDLEEREYREMEMPPMLEDDTAVVNVGVLEITENTKNDQNQHFEAFHDAQNEISASPEYSPMELVISNAVSDADFPGKLNNANNTAELHKQFKDQSTELNGAEITATCPQQQQQSLKICSVSSEILESKPRNEVSQAAEISGSIIQNDDVTVQAVPFHEPTSDTSSEEFAGVENDLDTEEEINTSERLDSTEELQNQLNHEMSSEHSQAFPLQTLQARPFLTEVTTLHSDGVEVTPTTSASSTAPAPSNISALPNVSGIPNVSALSIAPTKLIEETENLINEISAAAVRFESDVRLPLLLTNDGNINEIAENNNNANIERELQDDTLSAAELDRAQINEGREDQRNNADIT